ncbi:glycosyl transferase family 1 [Planctomycetales bacterium]|nr:glycosyl transferase family 1 [Planctomycetales bacterium]
MKIVFLSPGAGNMYCGNCLRDNALAAELHRQGHDVITVPLYLPPMLDEPGFTESVSSNTPVFFGGMNVYFEQKLPFYKYIPKFVRRALDSRWVLKNVGSRAAATQPAKVGDMTVSMLQGEHGHQKRELDELCDFLKSDKMSGERKPPDAIVFSNALLLGMHDAVKEATGAKTVCLLSGEDSFLDNLTEPYKTECWQLVSKHAANVDAITAPSRFYADFMTQRLTDSLCPSLGIQILPPGINLDGYKLAAGFAQQIAANSAANIGFFARMTHSKGLDTLVDAFIEVRKRKNFYPKLKIGGGYSKYNLPFVQAQTDKLEDNDLATIEKAQIFPNLTRSEKIKFLESLTLFSVPSRLNEPFGLYVLEAFAAGIPCLFPNRGAFSEIAEQSGACVLFESENSVDLADKIEELLADEEKQKTMSDNGRKAVLEKWNITESAKTFLALMQI